MSVAADSREIRFCSHLHRVHPFDSTAGMERVCRLRIEQTERQASYEAPPGVCIWHKSTPYLPDGWVEWIHRSQCPSCTASPHNRTISTLLPRPPLESTSIERAVGPDESKLCAVFRNGVAPVTRSVSDFRNESHDPREGESKKKACTPGLPFQPHAVEGCMYSDRRSRRRMRRVLFCSAAFARS